MNGFETLDPAEQARQLANPEGATGLAVAAWLNGNNRESSNRMLALLAPAPGHRILEIGFGNGRTAADLLAQAPDVTYEGIDPSPTMVAEATRFNAAAVAAGRAVFHQASAERMPFPDHGFDCVFSLGVIHFWADPVGPLAEVRRVLRPGGRALMGCLHPRTAPAFARPEYGFHLREPEVWEALGRAAGFGSVAAAVTETGQIDPDGSPTRRMGVRLTLA